MLKAARNIYVSAVSADDAGVAIRMLQGLHDPFAVDVGRSSHTHPSYRVRIRG